MIAIPVRLPIVVVMYASTFLWERHEVYYMSARKCSMFHCWQWDGWKGAHRGSMFDKTSHIKLIKIVYGVVCMRYTRTPFLSRCSLRIYTKPQQQ